VFVFVGVVCLTDDFSLGASNGNYVRSLAFLIEAVANRKVAMDDATAMFVGQSENITSVSSRRVTRTSQTYEGNFN
jgi:hypothetical protein